MALTELLPGAQQHQVLSVPCVSVFNFCDSLYPPCKDTRKLRLRDARQFSEGQTGRSSGAGSKAKPATRGRKLELEPERSRGGDRPLPQAAAVSQASVRNGISGEETGPALVCHAHHSAGDAVWDLRWLPTHVCFSLRLISITMRVYTKSRKGRGAKPKATVHADGDGSFYKH